MSAAAALSVEGFTFAYRYLSLDDSQTIILCISHARNRC
jgi:hypothetical protein